MRKRILQNEKGSVLTVAIALIALLSFVVTSVTAYTYNSAERSYSSLEGQMERMRSETYINRAITRFHEYIIKAYEDGDWLTENFFDEFNADPDASPSFHEIYQELLEDFQVTVRDMEDNDDPLTRTYRFSRTREDGTRIRRDFFLSFHGSEMEEMPTSSEDYVSNIEKELKEGSTEASSDEFESGSTDSAEVGSDGVTLNDDMYIDGDTSFDSFTTDADAEFNLDGNFFVVNGNLTISDGQATVPPDNTSFSKIYSDEPTLVLVLGNLYIKQNRSLEIENVNFIVTGYVDMLFEWSHDQHRRLSGENFAIYSFEDDTLYEDRVWDTLLGRIREEDDYTQEEGYDPLDNELNFNVRDDEPLHFEDTFYVYNHGNDNYIYTYIGPVAHDDEDRVTLEDIYDIVSPTSSEGTIGSGYSPFRPDDDNGED